jgi:hypothetical protein
MFAPPTVTNASLAPGAQEGDAVIVEERVVSRPGARVTETVFVLSEAAARALQTSAKIPPR